MTLIGIAAKGDSAEIITDEVGYSNEGARFRRTSKQQRFDHLGAVIMTSGNGRVARHAAWHAEFAAANSDNFDALVDNVPHWYEYALRDADFTKGEHAGMSGSLLLVGFSDRLGEFAAFGCTTHDTAPERLTGVFLQPAPFSLRPTGRQLKGFVQGLRAYGVPEEDIAKSYTAWKRAHALDSLPECDEDWIALAELVRAERSMNGPFMRVWVAGRLTLTTLRREETISRVIHEFDDQGELDRLVMGSLHPVAQIAPCTDCDSGRPAIDCCLPDAYFGKPCDCGGPDRKNFEDCCAVTQPETVRRRLWSDPSPYIEL